MKLRFAVIGTNFISDWVIAGARQDSRFELTAIYSRNQSTATDFAAKHKIPLTFTSLEEMACSKQVDAVYIASPNSFHAAQSILMMRHGKHVLCEKPLAANTDEVKLMIATAQEMGVTLMEAMKPTLTPNFAAVIENVHRVGKVRQYFSSFCQYSSRYDRFKSGELLNAFNPELASGAIMDLGIYTIYPLIVLFGRPVRVQASSTMLSTGVDGAGSILMEYPAFTATVLYSKIADAYLPTEIQGEQGTLTLDRVNIIREVAFRPRKFASSGIGPSSEPEILTRPTNQDEYYYEIKEFIDLVAQGRQQSSINTWDNSLATMEIIEAVRTLEL